MSWQLHSRRVLMDNVQSACKCLPQRSVYHAARVIVHAAQNDGVLEMLVFLMQVLTIRENNSSWCKVCPDPIIV